MTDDASGRFISLLQQLIGDDATDDNGEREQAALDQIREAYATGTMSLAEMELQTELAIRSNTGRLMEADWFDQLLELEGVYPPSGLRRDT